MTNEQNRQNHENNHPDFDNADCTDCREAQEWVHLNGFHDRDNRHPTVCQYCEFAEDEGF